ncbi:DNA polymerase III subunit epsilon [Oceanicoccus sagamiensis]|uniref:DNA polymerase III subunit epsilon n=1 Tax=Oceanicoccus sagamiensis TaxID=716816 RepID=A0A1X9NHH6_9GAMM|nr:DNA polymerase III subunit epsilon [Oceanicoccus sagamiensis]ARN75852.1 DNA polymerase III subunit epsilon [Oceanicoccus sagamiensis]
MRQVVLDTETTGLEPSQGHRIIEIGCVELVDRKLTGRHYHQYINPEREVEAGAIEVHGITNEYLADKPLFEQIVQDFVAFIDGAELVIHNAPFDVGFIDHEFKLLQSKSPGKVADYCSVVDSLVMARQKHPGQRNSLDALCSRYEVDNSARDLHGALLDAEILADVYLFMTGGQTNLLLAGEDSQEGGAADTSIRRVAAGRPALKIITADSEELAAHEVRLQEIDKASDGNNRWR